MTRQTVDVVRDLAEVAKRSLDAAPLMPRRVFFEMHFEAAARQLPEIKAHKDLFLEIVQVQTSAQESR